MCNLTELYQQVQRIVTLFDDTLDVFLSASVNNRGPYYSVGVTAPAFAEQGDVLGPEVARVSALTPAELLADLAQALKVENPYAAGPTLAELKAEITRLVQLPAINARVKAMTLIKLPGYSAVEAAEKISELNALVSDWNAVWNASTAAAA